MPAFLLSIENSILPKMQIRPCCIHMTIYNHRVAKYLPLRFIIKQITDVNASYGSVFKPKINALHVIHRLVLVKINQSAVIGTGTDSRNFCYCFRDTVDDF